MKTRYSQNVKMLIQSAVVFSLTATLAIGQQMPPTNLRSTLLDGLHDSHDKADWYVPVGTAIAGLTSEQARWVPTNSANKIDPNFNHSVGMLTYHLWFWNARALAKINKAPIPQAPGSNDETFNDFDDERWTQTVHNLDETMRSLETLVAHASNSELAEWASTLRNVAEHNAYHTGQIVYVRKLQGSWNPADGVK